MMHLIDSTMHVGLAVCWQYVIVIFYIDTVRVFFDQSFVRMFNAAYNTSQKCDSRTCKPSNKIKKYGRFMLAPVIRCSLFSMHRWTKKYAY